MFKIYSIMRRCFFSYNVLFGYYGRIEDNFPGLFPDEFFYTPPLRCFAYSHFDYQELHEKIKNPQCKYLFL